MTTARSDRNVMLIAVIGFSWNGVLTRSDNVLTSIIYTSVTRAAGAHIIIAVRIHTCEQKHSAWEGGGGGGAGADAIKCSCQQLICLQLPRGSRFWVVQNTWPVQSLYSLDLFSSFWSRTSSDNACYAVWKMEIDSRRLLFVSCKQMSRMCESSTEINCMW